MTANYDTVIEEFLSYLDKPTQSAFLRFLDQGNEFTAQEMVVMSPGDLEALLEKGGFRPTLKSAFLSSNLQSNPEYQSLLKQSSHQLWLAACKVSNPLASTNLSKLLQESSTLPKLLFNDPVIDNCLGSLFFTKGIVDIVGEASSGKTQFCLQVALNCITPIEFGGCERGCIYINTEGDFPIKRWDQMVAYRTQKIENSFLKSFTKNESFCASTPPNPLQSCPKLLVNQMIIEKISGVEEMDALLNRLRAMIRLKKVAVLIIDSITNLVKDYPNDYKNKEIRDSILYRWSASLQETSDDCKISVLTTSHVVDLFEEAPGSPQYIDPRSHLGLLKRHSSFVTSGRWVLPSLGLRWTELINSRIALKRTSAIYHGQVTLSKNKQNITKNDMNDMDEENEPRRKKIKTSEIEESNQSNQSNSNQNNTKQFNSRLSTSAWDDATVIIRKMHVLFSPSVPSKECLYFVDGVGLHGIDDT